MAEHLVILTPLEPERLAAAIGEQRLTPASDRRNVVVLEHARELRQQEQAVGELLRETLAFRAWIEAHRAAGTLELVRPEVNERMRRLVDAAEQQQGDRHG